MDQTQPGASVTGQEHWTKKGDIRLFLWEKFCGRPDAAKGTAAFRPARARAPGLRNPPDAW